MTDPSEQLGSFFFTVKYGKNQSRIFNANCRNELLLENIRNQCKCSNNDTIELSDERGRVKNIRNNKDDYGIKFIKERENVILLKVEATSNGTNSKEKPKYIPLLQELQENAAFIDAVNLGKTTEDDPLFRRRSSTTTPDQNELSSSRGSSKSKSSGSSKRKGVGRRQSSRLLVKHK